MFRRKDKNVNIYIDLIGSMIKTKNKTKTVANSRFQKQNVPKMFSVLYLINCVLQIALGYMSINTHKGMG